MLNINLLPWRQFALRKKQRNLTTYAIAAVIMAILISVVCHINLQRQAAQLKKSVFLLQRQLSNLQMQGGNPENLTKEIGITKNKLVILKSLLNDRRISSLILNELSTITPGDLYFFSVSKNAKEIIINGNAATLNSIAKLMQNIKYSKILTDPQLINSKINDDTRSYSFTMKLQLNKLPAEL